VSSLPRKDKLTEFAELLLRIRQSREQHFPAEMFGGDLGWDMLLVLFICDARGERLTGEILASQFGGSLRAGQRWIQYLTTASLIVGDGEGNLAEVLTLTPVGLHALETWLKDARRALCPDTMSD
jgi:hypothetical protein